MGHLLEGIKLWSVTIRLMFIMHQRKQKIATVQIKYASKNIITAHNYPSVLWNNHHLQYDVDGDSMGEGVF